MRIPKLIHQTWKNEDIPSHFKELRQTWIDHHPEWQLHLWTDKTNRAFVADKFPELLPGYDGFETNIQRADFIRYLLLYELGGVYVDLDFECFANLEDLLQDHGCVFSKEPQAHCKMHSADHLICNAFMASIPKHPFIKLIIDEAIRSTGTSLDPNTRVMETTGPFMVTRVYDQYAGLEELTILDPRYVYPLTGDEVTCLLHAANGNKKLQTKLDGAFAVHYWLNTWVV